MARRIFLISSVGVNYRSLADDQARYAHNVSSNNHKSLLARVEKYILTNTVILHIMSIIVKIAV